MSRCLLSINSGGICRIGPLHMVSCCFSSSKISATSKQTFSKPDRPNIVLVDAVRTPFLQSRTMFKNMMAMDLQRAALLGITFFHYFCIPEKTNLVVVLIKTHSFRKSVTYLLHTSEEKYFILFL